MKKVGVCAAAAAALIGGGMLLFAPAPASATTLPGIAIAVPGDAAMVEDVRNHRRRDARRYDRRRHGSRYRTRRPGFHHYYGGYYYANPWWVGPGFGIGVTVPVVPAPPAYVPSAHVEWCMRYRTYDPATDTYVPRVGVRARCISPYM